MKNNNLKISGIMIAGIIIIVSFAYAINVQPIVIGGSGWLRTYAGLNTFDSYEYFIDFLASNTNRNFDYWLYEDSISIPNVLISQSKSGRNGLGSDGFGEGKVVDYSETNIQVEGVDEPDLVKTDGTYLYVLADSKIYIIKAYPAENANILSVVNFEDDINVQNFFLNNNRLITFGGSQRDSHEPLISKTSNYYYPYWWGITTTVINIVDISDKENPEIIKNIEADGSFFDARMIGDYIYIITTEHIGQIYQKYDDNVTINIPEITINDYTRCISIDDIYYVNNSEEINSMTHIISIDIFGDEVDQKGFLLGYTQTMYVSNNNIFLACQEYSYYYPTWTDICLYEEYTTIHKISIENGKINYVAKGRVPGYTLNQFSMDEYNGFFRIATQKWSDSTTNLYILDEDMNRTSEIENIAPGERMHSARFMGDKAYLVTFKKVDPFFTLDLSDPYNPKILGILKIPGYSDYLHPYDENHIIGIGKDTIESESGDFAWYQGLKIALFDVSDFDNPKEIAKVIIGDRGTNSPVLYDHKALLFDRERELLVLPISLYEISDEIKENNNDDPGWTYGEFKFQGAFVYSLSIENGFEFKGKITHRNDEVIPQNYRWYWGSSNSDIIRSLYIGDVLYTISNNMVKMNNLENLSEINSVELS